MYLTWRGLTERWEAATSLRVMVALAPTIPLVIGALELVIPLNRDDWSYRQVWPMGAIIYLGSLAYSWRRYR